MTDAEFVQAWALKLNIGWMTASMNLQQIADTLFVMLGTKDIRDAGHLKLLLSKSPCALIVADVEISADDERRLLEILVKYR